MIILSVHFGSCPENVYICTLVLGYVHRQQLIPIYVRICAGKTQMLNCEQVRYALQCIGTGAIPYGVEPTRTVLEHTALAICYYLYSLMVIYLDLDLYTGTVDDKMGYSQIILKVHIMSFHQMCIICLLQKGISCVSLAKSAFICLVIQILLSDIYLLN